MSLKPKSEALLQHQIGSLQLVGWILDIPVSWRQKKLLLRAYQ
uniref:Uncharacterized protein n=1 Tax=Arundo donax TaxID=35708 RepID=A0A0A9D2D6_ARUDO